MAYEKFRIARTSTAIGRVAPGPGGDTMRIAAQTFSRIGGLVSDMADRAAAREGNLKGAEAGFDPEFRPRRDGTIYGENFDQAALRTHATMLDGEIRKDLAAAYDETGHDPVAFETRAGEIYKKRIETLPVEIRPELAAQFERQTFAYNRDLARRQQEIVLEEQRGALTAGMAQRLADFGRQAYTLGLDADADERLSAEAEDIAGWLATFGPKEAFSFGGREFAADAARGGVIGADDIAKYVVTLESEAAFNRVKGAFDRTKGIAARTQYLEDFMAQWQAGEGVTKSLSLDGAEALQGWMQTQINADLAEQRAAQAEINRRIANARSALSEYRSFPAAGLVPPPGVIAQIEQEARVLGDPALQADVAQFKALSAFAGNIAVLPPAQLEAGIQAMRAQANAQGATPFDAERIKLAEQTLAAMSTALERDPVSWGVNAGIVPPTPLAITGDPETGFITIEPGSLAARVAAAQRVAAQYGGPVRPFTEQDTALLKSIEAQGGNSMAGTAQTLVETMGVEAPQALAQLSDNAPRLAHIGGLLAQGSPASVIRDASRGFELLNGEGKGGLTTANRDPATEANAAMISDAILRKSLPENHATRKTIEETARAIYVGRNGLGAPFDQASYTRAVQEAAGATFINGAQFGGVTDDYLLAPNWMRADRLKDALFGLDATDFKEGGVSGGPRDALGNPLDERTLMRKAWPTSVAPGVYRFLTWEGGEVAFVGDETGAAYTLDLNRIRHRHNGEWLNFTRFSPVTQ